MQRNADTHSKKARGSNAVRLFGFLLACTLLAPATVNAQSATPPLYEQTEPPGSGAMTPPPVSSQPLSLTPSTSSAPGVNIQAGTSELRLQQLEGQFRTLTGKMEETDHQLQLLQQSMDQITARLTALEQKQALTPASTPGAPVAPAATPTLPNAPDVNAVPPSPAGMPPQPGATSSGSLTQPDLAPPASDKFSGGTAGANPSASTLGTLTQPKTGSVTTAATPLTPPKAAAANTPDAAYEQAYAMFTAKKYDEAEAAFQAFLSKYPKHPLAANAQFWIGESQYARNQYDKAAKSFAIAYQNYPQGPKGPDSLLKLGMSLSGLGKTNEACLTWAQLKKQFPSAGPILTRAASESQKNACKS